MAAAGTLIHTADSRRYAVAHAQQSVDHLRQKTDGQESIKLRFQGLMQPGDKHQVRDQQQPECK